MRLKLKHPQREEMVQARDFVEEKCWQYMIDHAQVSRNGKIKVAFDIDNRADWNKKLASRVWTSYTFQNAQRVEDLAKQRRADFQPLKWMWYHHLHHWLIQKVYKVLRSQMQYYHPDMVVGHIKRNK